MELSKLRFGIEIEFYNLTKKAAANVLLDCLENSKLTISSSYRSVVTSKKRDWTITTDRSLHNTVDEPRPYKQQYTGEFVTPVLTLNDLPLLLNIVSKLSEAGAKSDAQHGCSVHVHVDASHLRACDLVIICKQHKKIYNDICKTFNLTRTQINTYAKDLPEKFVSSLSPTMTKERIKSLWYTNCNKYAQANDVHYNKSRYHVVNLHSIYEGHGIEYRYFKFYTDLDTKLLNGIILYSLLMTLPRSTVFPTLRKLLEDLFKDNNKEYVDIIMNQFPYKIVKAEKEDLDEIYSLYSDRVKWFKIKSIRQWSTYLKDHPKEQVENLINKNIFYKVIINNEIVGAFELSKNSRFWNSNDDAYYIWMMVTKVGTRGIGTKIIDFSKKKCKEDSVKYLRTYNLSKSKKLESICDDYGFKTVKYYESDNNKFSLRQIEIKK